ncbi:MAG: cobalamin biosynthesis protein CobD [Eggerthellaceae bacterium]|nr:cobalamin biosynthesis protein CobD [Eggerthellaceae bacterium]
MRHVLAIAIGFALDLLLGDPYTWPHPIRWIGKLIAVLEKPLRKVFPKTASGERIAGGVLVVLVVGISFACAVGLLWACALLSWWLALVVESVLCYQMLATKALRDESMKVAHALEQGTLDDARKAVSMIVGRDTQSLDHAGVAKAAIETVAENVADGVIAPLLYMAIGGAPLGVLYKAANTMDSMVGYKNDTYRHFGTIAAKLDDVLNFVPARIAGLLMCLAALLVHQDARGAWRIFKRDRLAHSSPNSAHTEAACAGALGVQLAGSNYYFGKLVEKPTIGDATRAVETADIARANRLMYATASLGFLLAEIVCALLFLAWGGLSW